MESEMIGKSERVFCDICGREMGSGPRSLPAERGIYEDGDRWRVQIARYAEPAKGRQGFRILDLCDECNGGIVACVRVRAALKAGGFAVGNEAK